MKTHIFIATTQGLVAIQNITAIDDEDISSVVSVNGTSTTANISGSYHNFVKKGVGIIQQMFGACSYRVDISARIDQGNSWQLAMYLAHLAQSQGVLGNGEVKQGDTVICATGEINTSNHQVLAVGEVAVKFKLAQSQLTQWTALGAKVHFLLPLANQTDIENNQYSQVISNLEQAAAALPDISPNIRSSISPEDKANNGNPKQSTTSSNKKSVSINFQYKTIIIICTLAIIVFFGVNQFSLFEGIHQQTNAQADHLSSQGNQLSAQLIAELKQDNSCAQTTTRPLALNQQTFTDLAIKQLCDLSLQTDSSKRQVLLIAQDAYTVLPLQKSPKGWQIPLPKNRDSNRSYYLVSLDKKLSDEQIEQLRLHRETMKEPTMLTESALSDWLAKQQVSYTIYTHELLI